MNEDGLDLRPPRSFSDVSNRLEDAGFEAWAVGGAVRDRFLGVDRDDWDLATSARPNQVVDLFRRTVPLGIEHGTVGVLDPDGVLYEVTTFRKDVETDGRHAVVEFAETIEDDLARRDFTINAIAWRERTGELRDPWDGRSDLEARVLRAVGEPAERFAEDYLRVLRGLRFAGVYGLAIDPPTREALEEAVNDLGQLSAERVREELVKVLAAPEPSATLQLYRDTGALGVWYPELELHANEAAWDEALAAIDELNRYRGHLRLCRLLLVIPTQPSSEPEAEPGFAAASTVLKRLKFSSAEQRRALHLYQHFLPFISPVDSAADIREWLHQIGPGNERDLFRLHFAAARAARADDAIRALVFVWRRAHDERLSGAPIERGDLAVDGNDVLSLGMPGGPLVGLLLDELHARVLEDPDLNTRYQLLEQARELIDMAGLADASPEPEAE
ncbi:MAG: CCA tRNA nucleotidyltransferase [Gemmatimonadales bacterium]|nr:MAG: CCA tRNA nucleotidyltransferase [Gemmatimonadales bacterium]